jgi:short-chain fatty acids transporter
MSPVARLGDRAARLAQSLVPDPFVIAILLAVLAFIIAMIAGDDPGKLITSFASGALEKGLIAFAFQMALILVTGHALAETRPVRAALATIAGLPRTAPAAAATVAAVAITLGLLNWGLGLVAGAFLAREVGRAFHERGEALNYPLIGAAGYLGLLVWHGGLSGSAPLKVAKDSDFGPAIPIDASIFSGLNLAITAVLLVGLPLLFALLAGGDAPEGATEPPPREEPLEELVSETFAGKLENTWFTNAALALLLTVALVAMKWQGQALINLNGIILIFLTLGLWLHKSPRAFGRAFGEGTRGAAGILLQFPIYFGILALLRDSGALTLVAESTASAVNALSGVLSPTTGASWFTFASAAILNMLVPSGGGQWALQAPIIQQTAERLAIDRAHLVMAFSYGDQLTNMLQPFWALPLLSITGLKAREVLGYTMIAMVAATPVFLVLLALL